MYRYLYDSPLEGARNDKSAEKAVNIKQSQGLTTFKDIRGIKVLQFSQWQLFRT